MVGSFLLSAALSLGQVALPTDPSQPVDKPDIPAAAAQPDTPPAAATPQPGVMPAAFADDKAPAAEPAAPPAAEDAKPVTISAPLLPPPVTPPAPPAPPAATTPPDRWALQKIYQGTGPGVCLDTNRMSIYGWLEGSYTIGSVPHNNLPESLNYHPFQPLLQQFWTRFNRSVVTSGTTEPTFGFNVDLLIGTDYRFTLPRGLYNKQLTDNDGLPANYGLDPVQFFAEAYIPTISRGLDIKVGRFYTPYGVESLEAPSTQFMSHSYIFANGSPFTHTGVLATQNLPYNLIAQVGLVAGEDIVAWDTAAEPTGIFTLQWAQPANRNNVKFTAIVGSAWFNQNEGFSGIAGNPNYDIFDVVWAHIFDSVPRLSSNVEALYGYMNNVPDALASNGVDTIHINHADWWGVAGYLQYVFGPTVVGNFRAELFDDVQGIRTNTFPGAAPDNCKGLYSEITAGVTFKPRRQPSGNGIILFQPEIRYDYNFDSKPFDNAHHGLFTVGSNMVIRW